MKFKSEFRACVHAVECCIKCAKTATKMSILQLKIIGPSNVMYY